MFDRMKIDNNILCKLKNKLAYRFPMLSVRIE